ncbi:MAG TPA: tetratricopeptide repeat protein [Pyrinomonadaceae bacterium]|nr:tetratricopeptide repeat protein [Pyrinomonadaceae bacterium]
MSTPLVTPRPFLIALTLICLCWLTGVAADVARAQQQQLPPVFNEDTAQAIELYRRGEMTAALNALSKVVEEREDDVNAQYYLGLALYSVGELDAARPSFEAVVKLLPEFADAHAKLALPLILNNDAAGALREGRRALELGDRSAEVHYAVGEAHLRQDEAAKALEEAEAALRIRPDMPEALILKSFASYDLKRHHEAAESLERFLKLNPNDEDAETWREQVETWRRFGRTEPEDKHDAPRTTFSPKEVEKKAHLLSRPEPQYSAGARKAGAQGTVVLRAVLSSDGTVKNMYVKRALGYGLTTRAVRAARMIKFEPATIGGRPVSQYIQIEYNFNLY